MIKFHFRFSNGDEAIINSKDAGFAASVTWSPPEAQVKDYLKFSYGLFGHLLNVEFTSPIDLYAAIVSNANLNNYEVIEGEDKIVNFILPLPPKGSMF